MFHRSWHSEERSAELSSEDRWRGFHDEERPVSSIICKGSCMELSERQNVRIKQIKYEAMDCVLTKRWCWHGMGAGKCWLKGSKRRTCLWEWIWKWNLWRRERFQIRSHILTFVGKTQAAALPSKTIWMKMWHFFNIPRPFNICFFEGGGLGSSWGILASSFFPPTIQFCSIILSPQTREGEGAYSEIDKTNHTHPRTAAHAASKD